MNLKNSHFDFPSSRVLSYLDECYSRERRMTSVLSIGPEDHVKVAEKISKTAKTSTKKLQNVLRELAAADAKKIKVTREIALAQFIW